MSCFFLIWLYTSHLPPHFLVRRTAGDKSFSPILACSHSFCGPQFCLSPYKWIMEVMEMGIIASSNHFKWVLFALPCPPAALHCMFHELLKCGAHCQIGTEGWGGLRAWASIAGNQTHYETTCGLQFGKWKEAHARVDFPLEGHALCSPEEDTSKTMWARDEKRRQKTNQLVNTIAL